MTKSEIDNIVTAQRAFFASGATLDPAKRVQKLKALRAEIIKREPDILDALYNDLGKSATEAYMTEVGMALSELSYMIKHTKKFAARQKVKTPLAQFPAKSFRLPSPYGVTLIMSPWNYPFLLSVEPLTEAIAAGNTVVLKPSAYSPHTDSVITELISAVFEPEYVATVSGGREENAALLKTRFDYIFFTGSKTVGKLVYESAAAYLTPVTLELGGKSPCIVDGTANIPLAARRIVFGKFLNCGQTCVAPDYILCSSSVKDELIACIKSEIAAQYGADPLNDSGYGKMISQKHFDRVAGLIDNAKVMYGGKINRETLKIEPTVMDNVEWSDPVMGEEIFGPALPVLTYDGDLPELINSHDSPLALYIFSTDRQKISDTLERTRFGGGCVNDVIIHLASSVLPFGGVGESGIGSYHGLKGFETFSHYKSVVQKSNRIDLSMRYRPYTKKADGMIRRFLK